MPKNLSHKDYTPYLFNKANQYKDSDALRLKSQLNLYVIYAPGTYFKYALDNNSLQDLLITRVDFRMESNNSTLELEYNNNTIWSGFETNPVDISLTSFSGPESYRIVPAGTIGTTTAWNLSWFFASPAGYTFWYYMTVYFSNGTVIADAYEFDGVI